LVRSVKNSFAPINRIPPEILVLIPRHYDKACTDQDLIALTHVCRGWRDSFTSCSSLWTNLDPTNVDKTRTYIQRSKSSPLEMFVGGEDMDNNNLNSASLLVVPHIRRLKSLIVWKGSSPNALKHFYCHVPLLERLVIDLAAPEAPALDSALFKGDLSSLCMLSLGGVVTTLPWNNLANLRMFKLTSCPPRPNFITQLLDLFECAPVLCTIELKDSIPTSSDTHPGRTVSLPRLNTLAITARPGHSILLNHLLIPTGASLILNFGFRGTTSPLRVHLPETFANLKNLSHITIIHLLLDEVRKYVRFSGPSGVLNVLARCEGGLVSRRDMDRLILRSLSPSILSTAQRLTVSKYQPLEPAEIEKSPAFRTLSHMNKLRTLTLTKCHNLPFILALNPQTNPSRLMLCPHLAALVLHIKSQDQFHIRDLLSMTKQRALRGAKLSSITIVGLNQLASAKVFRLREHVIHVDYKADDVSPNWDHLPGDSGDEDE